MIQRRKILQCVTDRLIERSKRTRESYLMQIEAARQTGPLRGHLSCGNLAHGFAACSAEDKVTLAGDQAENIGIVTAYNDMLSAHQPYETYPSLIKEAAKDAGGVAQVAAGVPAMCDGITQGQFGMELSLFSRDVIAMATAIGLSHNMFDAAVMLGICDKIVPGMLIGALSYGHLPVIFVPAGPMQSGLPNPEKQRVRQLHAEGKIGRDELLKAEMDSYHSPGTCNFYGTANSNQMLMEFMGLQLPGSSFVNPGTLLRDSLTKEATNQVLSITASGNRYTPIADVISAKSIVNGIVGLHATGGSTNHAIHLIAIAKRAGIELTLEDISDISDAVPLLARVYPNGMYDVNYFHAAGGLPYLIRELLEAGLLHEDVKTISGDGLGSMTKEPGLDANGKVTWKPAPLASQNEEVLTTVRKPFRQTGGLKVLDGNLGKAIIKISAVKPEHRMVEAPIRVFLEQDDLKAAFDNGELDCDFIAVCPFQGPTANGMPELHKLVPTLGVLQDRGHKVALITDGRMSGASGKVPAAIHLSPEAVDKGPISRLKTGDVVVFDAENGRLNVKLTDHELSSRTPQQTTPQSRFKVGTGLFEEFRSSVTESVKGASAL